MNVSASYGRTGFEGLCSVFICIVVLLILICLLYKYLYIYTHRTISCSLLSKLLGNAIRMMVFSSFFLVMQSIIRFLFAHPSHSLLFLHLGRWWSLLNWVWNKLLLTLYEYIILVCVRTVKVLINLLNFSLQSNYID